MSMHADTCAHKRSRLHQEAHRAMHFNHRVHFISSALSFITGLLLIRLHNRAEEEEPALNSSVISMASC